MRLERLGPTDVGAQKLAVVYLARQAEGLAAIEAFVESYKTHPAGIPHDLIVMCKGDTTDRDWFRRPFDEVDATLLFMADAGFDIQAYLNASHQIPHATGCYLNTFSQIQHADWLRNLYAAFCDDNVGLVGASGTYESVVDSLYFHVRAFWEGHEAIMTDPEFKERFRSILEVHRPEWLDQALRGKQAREKRLAREPADREGFLKYWFSQISGDGPLSQYARFPRFPNPHVRTNAFLVAVQDFISFARDVKDDKISCLEFENGETSLTNQVLASGKQALVVAADGKSFAVHQCKTSGVFRQGEQESLLVSDNQTRAYLEAPEIERQNLRWLSWGEAFPASATMRGFVELPPHGAPIAVKGDQAEVFISVVIPTHDRLDLVKQAIDTVRVQQESGWELIVFDNASTEPVSDYVNSIADPRVRCVRSDTFLDVTTSWNTAYDLAKGDYVMLFGDDDGLAPGFFSRVRALITEFQSPDLIYFPILQFFHRGVAPWQSEGYVEIVRLGDFFAGRTSPFFLSDKEKEGAVVGSLTLRRNFLFNMQGLLFKRDAAENLKVDGRLFQSPFPDYYIANVAICLLDRVLISPTPVAIAGVSRASFGFTLFNNEEARGHAMLKTKNTSDRFWREMQDVVLAGPAYATNYIITMRHVYERTKQKVKVKPSYDRYRRMQILASLGENYSLDRLRVSERAVLWGFRQLSARRSISPRADRTMHKIERHLSMTAGSATQLRLDVGGFSDTRALYEALESGWPIQGYDGTNRWIVRRPRSNQSVKGDIAGASEPAASAEMNAG